MSKRANKKNIMKIIFFVYMIFLFLVVAVKFTGNNMSTVIERWNIISSAKEAGEKPESEATDYDSAIPETF